MVEENEFDKVKIIRLANLILSQAATNGVSEIHIEPFENDVRVRYRQDGELFNALEPPKSVFPDLVARLFEMASIEASFEVCCKLPTDGWLRLKINGNSFNFILSSVPTVWGPKICIRVLKPSEVRLNIDYLGIDPIAKRRLDEALQKKAGLIILAGPTGSGKTTTQMSILNFLNAPDKNILTAESPVEYLIPGVNQVNCKPEIGYFEAMVIRKFIDQNSDVIKVKLEDFERVKEAFRAASKGTLVLGSMHTNDAPSVLTRLMNTGIEPFWIADYVFLIQAQRLAGKLCPNCREEFKPSSGILRSFNINQGLLERIGFPETDPAKITFFKSHGCELCKKGFSGRVLCCESLKVTEAIRELVMRKHEYKNMLGDIRQKALSEGMITLRESGIRRALLGETTLERVGLIHT
ncbi:MAG: Flp pilus assembly complex ATPase component TadA [Candidatus Riflebacteria bacterium]|nr:Flp pilus assembly complex ATPase component TadA [Candidatus Riflebacteria bacterium]